MDTAYVKTAVTALWMLGVCGLGLVANSDSLSAWLALAGVAVLPPLVLARFWGTPAATMSERIASGRRR
jgi:hypothetical protein